MPSSPLVIDPTPILPDTDVLLHGAVRIGFAILIGLATQQLLFVAVGRVEHWIRSTGRDSPHARQRAVTVGHLLRNLINILVGAGVLVHALEIIGWDVKPLLAGAGIVGVALGFGAQALVRDVIAGIFIIADDQFGVGDVVEINGRVATVEVVTVRQTTLRDFNGFLLFVPNGELKIVVNRSRQWNRVAVDVPIATDQALEPALDVCRRVAIDMSADPQWKPRLLGDIETWGIERLGPQEVQVRLVVRGRPGADTYEAARELRRRLLVALGEAGVRHTLPFAPPVRTDVTAGGPTS
ncbi:MAG: mechanosensitive ion channel family protein [Candidatus Eisenbacteria bacterium]